jgi:hypothetical protein
LADLRKKKKANKEGEKKESLDSKREIQHALFRAEKIRAGVIKFRSGRAP